MLFSYNSVVLCQANAATHVAHPMYETVCILWCVWQLVQLLLRRGANAKQSNLRGKTPVDVAATDVIARLLRGDDHAQRNHSAASSDDSDESRSPVAAATSPNSVSGCISPRLTPGTDSSSYHICFVYSVTLCFPLHILRICVCT